MSIKSTRSNSVSNVLDENMMETLVSKLIPKLIQLIEEQLAPKLTEKIEERLDKLTNTIEKMENKLKDVVDKLVSLEKQAQTNKQEIKTVTDKLDVIEQNLKRNTLRLVGVKEEENEHLLSKVLNIINDALKIKCAQWEIDNIYRVGKRNENQTRTRQIIVTFVSYVKKNEVYMARTGLKGSGIFINEDLTKKLYKLFTDTKKKFGPHAVWSRNGRIYVKRDNAVEIINSQADLLKV